MKLGTETRLIISASAKPGNFGATIYNQLFSELGINAIYLPVKTNDAARLIEAIRTLGVSGCSVSMPLKTEVLSFLDEVDSLATSLKSVNTIVRTEMTLKGFNTDFYGARSALAEARPTSAVIYGAGSVASAVVMALRDLGCLDIRVLARNPSQMNEFAKKHSIGTLDDRSTTKPGAWLINVTPASALTDKSHDLYTLLEMPFEGVFDLVVSPTDTPWITSAKALGLKSIVGIEMSKYQLQAQFELYTGVRPDITRIDSIIRESFR